jgi:hypothetical protein
MEEFHIQIIKVAMAVRRTAMESEREIIGERQSVVR